jgi:hypothetical protein
MQINFPAALHICCSIGYRIDYLIVPEGKVLREIEKIVDIYFKKENARCMRKIVT